MTQHNRSETTTRENDNHEARDESRAGDVAGPAPDRQQKEQALRQALQEANF
ncbi:hypothetical protein [Methylobacter sp. YRD-M1]|jgi:hypothetical protein|uniref:hypothetical protein n=1 Tax=Methylobacter sp. YRD-M1 TaxID=2911520 RepID=UPI00227CD939|nr:hypothetical protein [Methylobacter sp. YRD-M1]WAK04286.1 hypothetical protein LZ558_21695 [Methylobacter sp. YRD-M1]